ncbi:hypothetical protein JWZ98_22825 (plasmid) [Methylomonas sp. EFPC1]|uniref:hypothetical protein n=1 Tax=Methylomonas sp. EFPC1 TaxID=2812647 RepID=UPI000D2E5390|nr:hypothetical protein [Methylomonas sp. EFPC1]PPD24608.1 MAG: hypothetical protein CTY24_00010 [Methylobacter sp.]QSB03821.1 hypothetical protein JWZ98_22825 [Methylomonas sp. EFPC1]
MDDILSTPRRLRCTRCATDVIGRQWPGQDIGWGLCQSCIEPCKQHAGSEEEFRVTHGVQGVHFDIQSITPSDNEASEREWLEDSRDGRFSRVAVGREDSVWVCNACGQDDADPWEYGCEHCDEKADAY